MKRQLRPVSLKRPAPMRRTLRTVGCFGEVLVTIAALAGLYLVYELWWTNIAADKEATSTSVAIREGWNAGTGSRTAKDLPGIGFLHIPALGKTGEIAVVEGTDPDRLNEGIAGFYTHPVRSAMPWDAEGNFTLAAHRDGHGAKFHNLNKLKSGDHVVMETKDKWYVYTVFATLPKTTEENTGVLDPIPTGSGRHSRGRYITLTTCTPVLTSDFRLIVWGELTRIDGMDGQRTPPPEADGA